MAEQEKHFAAYAVFSDVQKLLTRLREQGFPATMSYTNLASMGIADANCSRTFQALTFLNIVNPDGSLTDMGRRLKVAPTSDYATILQELVRSAYAHALKYATNPAIATKQEIEDAFREYEPSGQRERMIRLFRGLCVESGMRPAEDSLPNDSTQPKRTAAVHKRNRASATDRPKNDNPGNPAAPSDGQSNNHYAMLQTLIGLLPPQGQSWTRDRRDLFIKSFEVNLDILVPIEDSGKPKVNAKPRRPNQQDSPVIENELTPDA